MFSFLLAKIFCSLSISVTLSAVIFSFLLALKFYSLLVSAVLSTIVFYFLLAFLFILDYFIEFISNSKV